MNIRAVMISVRPQWCALIANGKKTLEVRKSKPKIEMPFKCYIYCTKDKSKLFWTGKRYSYTDDHSHNAFDKAGNGKIIGEFVCDNIDTYDDDTIFSFRHEDYARWNDFDLNRACIHPEDFQNYADGKWLYGWHISDLKIYDQPKEVGEFWEADRCPYISENGCTYKYHCARAGQTQRCGETLTRPPQSWCYVEGLEI